MDEILNKLLESELLSEEAKAEITEQFNTAVEGLREELALEVRAELVEQWTEQRDVLVQTVDEKVTEMLGDEINELKEDISRFRDLEVEYAEKLVGEKHRLAEQLGTEIDELVDKLDAFLEYRINEEMSELKEDLEVVRQNTFGRKIFEAFMSEFSGNFVDEESVQSQLNIAESQLTDAKKRLYELEQSMKKAERARVMEETLAPLSGTKREQMELILQNVETSKLQEAYNRFIGRLIKEEKFEEVEKEVVEEEVKTKKAKKPVKESKKPVKTTSVKTGDKPEVIEEETEDSSVDLDLLHTLRLAGVK